MASISKPAQISGPGLPSSASLQVCPPAEKTTSQPAAGCGIFSGSPLAAGWRGTNMARRRGVQKGFLHKQGSMWYVAFREDALDENGKIVRTRRNVRIGSTKEFSKREARRIADDEVLSRVNSQAVQPASLITLKQFVDGSFRPQHVWALKHSGKIHYDYILDKHVLPALGEMRLRDVASEHVQALVRLKVDSGLSVQTATHIRNVISAVFNHAKQRKAFYGDNPTFGVRMPEMQRKERHAMNFTQAKALVDELHTPAREMVLLSIVTSLNVAELLGLAWKWVNLEDESGTVAGEELPGRTLGVRQNFYPWQVRLRESKDPSAQCAHPSRSRSGPEGFEIGVHLQPTR